MMVNNPLIRPYFPWGAALKLPWFLSYAFERRTNQPNFNQTFPSQTLIAIKAWAPVIMTLKNSKRFAKPQRADMYIYIDNIRICIYIYTYISMFHDIKNGMNDGWFMIKQQQQQQIIVMTYNCLTFIIRIRFKMSWVFQAWHNNHHHNHHNQCLS